MLREFDDACMAAATRVAHGFQRLTGLTTYFIARLAVVLAMLSVSVDIMNHYHQFLAYKTPLGGLVIDILVMVAMVSDAVATHKAEESIGSATKPRILLRYLTHGRVWRLLLWFINVWQGIFTIALAASSPHPFLELLNGMGFPLGLLIFYYFIAVDPLPPGTSKVREWLQKLAFIPRLAGASK